MLRDAGTFASASAQPNPPMNATEWLQTTPTDSPVTLKSFRACAATFSTKAETSEQAGPGPGCREARWAWAARTRCDREERGVR